MSVDASATLRKLLEESPVCLAIIGPDGAVLLASRAFTEATGLGPDAKAPDKLGTSASDGDYVQFNERHFEIWVRSLASGQLVGLRDRTEFMELEDKLWEQQARLSKAWSDLSLQNQAMSSALEKLRQRESEVSHLNQELEKKVSDQVGELERSNRLRRYLPPEVVKKIVTGDAPDMGTRKRIVTVLFADIYAFDELVGEMESEEVIDLLNEYRREITGILFSHGGTLDKFISARVMAFFGDPLPFDDHVARAARTGLDIRERVSALWCKWFPQESVPGVQVGIHSGYATVGNVGSEDRADYTVIGKNVALAGNLQQEAKPGQILLSARTYEVVKDLFHGEAVQVVLKGSSRPIAAYDIRKPKSGIALPAEAFPATMIGEPKAQIAGLTGNRLGPYVVQEKLGEGGMGIVYKATDERLNRVAALKFLSAELAVDKKFVARFQREARALASINSPYIAQIYFISDESTPLFFAMEFVEGPTLRRVLQDQGKLPLRRALDLLTQMARGLQAAAEQGVIHRDVKPDNVMLTLKGQVKLTDFGLMKSMQEDIGTTSRGVILGTPLYMAPEQARGEEADLRSDIYSLGATFFHMLAGQPPFRGKTAIEVLRQHQEAELPALTALPPSISPTVYQFLRRMMAKRREDRFQTHEDVIVAIDAC